jgi:tetratricopeptide (TPR) repeat protein
MADIEKAIANSIDEPEAYYLRGFYYYAQKEDSAAMRDFKRAANLNSTNPETYHLIGNLCLLKGEYERADVAYDHAIRLDSMEPTYYLAKGILREKQQKIREAIEWYETSLKRNPAFIKGLFALHDVHLTKGRDPDQAYLYNERVMHIDSTQPLAHFNQGNFMIARANRITDSSKLPDFRALVNVAISEYGLALRYDPEFVQARYNRGYAYYLLEKYGQALADFTRVTELDPFHRDAFYMKANIQEFQGDLNGALENYRRSFEIDPKFSDAASAVKELSFRLKNQ